MDIRLLLIQAVGLVGIATFFLSFQCRNNRRLFLVQFLAYVFLSAHMLLLGAVTGGISYIINVLRSACLASKRKFAHSRSMCAVLCGMQLAALALTWNGWISILPVAANIAATIAGYTHNPRKIRVAGMFINSPLWLIYSIIVGSWAGILDEVITETSIIVSILRYGWKNLDRVEE